MLWKILLVITSLVFLGCDTQPLKEKKYINKNQLSFMSCELKIPWRYKLDSFDKDRKEYLFSYQNSNQLKKYIYNHRIRVERKENDYISLADKVFSENFNLISLKNFNDIKSFRYKGKDKEEKQNNCKNQQSCKEVDMYFKNNYLVVYGKDFIMIIEETDEYIDEIYKMIEDCAAQLPRK